MNWPNSSVIVRGFGSVVVSVRKYLISSFTVMVDAFCFVNFDAGEILGYFYRCIIWD